MGNIGRNVLRQRVTTDITTKGGAFDIMTIGMYETPIEAKCWLVPLDDLSADYNVGDLLPAMAGGLSYDGTLFAAPFYGERLNDHVPYGPDEKGGFVDAESAVMVLYRKGRARDD